jgi:hypothetical protein
MKPLRLLPERLQPSVLFVCLFEPATLFHYSSIVFYPDYAHDQRFERRSSSSDTARS